MKKAVNFLFVLAVLFCLTIRASADTFKVAIFKIPAAEDYKKLFVALGEVTDNIFKVEVVPPARATFLIEEKQVDVQVPRFKGKNEEYNKTLKYDFATVNLYKLSFVLYTNKQNQIDINDLRKGNSKGYKIETDGTNLKQFGFSAIFSNDPIQSFKKIDAKRIDGYINAQNTADIALKSLMLKNIHRQLWDSFDSSFALQKGEKGGKLDKILSDGINKLRASKKLEQIVGNMIRENQYKDWQPSNFDN